MSLVTVYRDRVARRIRAAGASYTPHYKSGNWIRPHEGEHFDDDQLALILDAVSDFRAPHMLTLTGTKLTDDSFAGFATASNINVIVLADMDITDVELSRLRVSVQTLSCWSSSWSSLSVGLSVVTASSRFS